MKRLALFQYEWPLQVHSTRLALLLAKAGYFVDFFVCKCSADFVDMNLVNVNENVNVIYVNVSLVDRLINKTLELLGSKVHASFRRIVPPSVVKKAMQNCDGKDYHYFIGIEKAGLLWARALADKTEVPVIYYSLELYIEDHPAFTGDMFFPRLRAAEKECHARCVATIIQDSMRGQTLARANGIKEMEWLYFPVSVERLFASSSGEYLYEKFGIDSGKKILLYFGMFGPERGSKPLAVFSRTMAPEYTMVLHGNGLIEDVQELRDIADGDKLILSLDMVPEDELAQLVASAHIGMALYNWGCVNDELTAFASEKVALYCRAGVPFVAFENASFKALIERCECGVLINRTDELADALATIEAGYDRFRKNALDAFDAIYCIENNFQVLRNYLASND